MSQVLEVEKPLTRVEAEELIEKKIGGFRGRYFPAYRLAKGMFSPAVLHNTPCNHFGCFTYDAAMEIAISEEFEAWFGLGARGISR